MEPGSSKVILKETLEEPGIIKVVTELVWKFFWKFFFGPFDFQLASAFNPPIRVFPLGLDFLLRILRDIRLRILIPHRFETCFKSPDAKIMKLSYILMSLWCCFGIAYVLFRYRLCVVLVSFWCCFVLVLTLFWRRFGVWCCCGVVSNKIVTAWNRSAAYDL